MKSIGKQVISAIFFLFVGAAVAIIALVGFESNSSQTTKSNKTTNTETPVANKNTRSEFDSKPLPTKSVSIDETDTSTQAKTDITNNKSAPITPNPSQEQTIQLKKGTPINAYDLMDVSKVMMELVPIYNSTDEIDKVAVYRFDDNGNKSLETMMPLPQSSNEFPPISLADATQKVQDYRPNNYANYQGKLVVYTGSDVPFYYFKADDSQGKSQTLLVDAYTGYVERMTETDLAEEKRYQETAMEEPMSVNSEGLLEVNEKYTQDMLPIEKEFMLAQKTLMNEMVKNGSIKLGNNGEIIQDNMTEAQMEAMDKKMRELEEKLMKNIESNALEVE